MESKTPIIWGKGYSHKVSLKFNPYFFFQGSEEGDGQTGEIAVLVLMGGIKPVDGLASAPMHPK